MKQLRIFFLALLGAGSLATARAQVTTPVSAQAAAPADTNNFRYYAGRKLEQELRIADPATYPRVQKLHARWLSFWSTRTARDTGGSGYFAPLSWAVDYALRQPAFCPSGAYSYSGNWSLLGPKTDFFGTTWDKSGRLYCIWASPTNKDSILAGASAGGLWRSIDGGRNWTNITDQLQSPQLPGTMGVRHIVVNPQDHRNIYIATGTENARQDYTLGVFYTTNGGQTWQADQSYRNAAGTSATGGLGFINSYQMILRMARSPLTGRIYLLTPQRILVLPAFGAAWQDITPPAVTGLITPPQSAAHMLWDMEFAKDGSGRIFFCTTNTYDHDPVSTQQLFTYQEGGGQWGQYPLTFPAVAGRSLGWVQNMTQATNGTLYFTTEYQGAGTGLLFAGNATGGNLTLRNSAIISAPRDVIASAQYPDVLYLLNTNGSTWSIHKSINGGLSWSAIGITHPDTRSLQIWQESSTATAGDEILFATTDGGAACKKAADNQFYSITGKGLHITQFEGFSQSHTQSGMLTAGATDNGNHAYHAAAATPWTVPSWGDGMRSAFTRNGSNQAYTMVNGDMYPMLQFSAAGLSTGANPGNPPDAAYGMRWHQPLWTDAQDVLHSGRFFIYKKGTTWNPAFSTNEINMGEPKPNIPNLNQQPYADAIRAHKNTVACIRSESDPNIAYIAYEDIFYNPADFAVADRYNLFVARQATIQPVEWNNISIPVTNIPVTDIAIDPLHANRIWVCYGGVVTGDISLPPASRTKRVYYSDNYGASWTDISKGLPMVPVHKLLYAEGTDDVLFAGTEVGVFRWNKGQGIWQCFNNGMPPCNVTGLDLNYCNGKLRASTFGRSIWETDYAADMDQVTPGFTHTFSSGYTVWNSSKTVSGSIQIGAGATLEIRGAGTTIYMPRQGRILVAPGGKLVIDGAVLTNNCAEGVWQGIEVTGSNGLPVADAWQGVLELRNGAVLQHARVAISNHSSGSAPGGIIRADGSQVLDCIAAVSLEEVPTFSYYDNVPESHCHFRDMTFRKSDPQYPADARGYFTARNIKGGIEVARCRFLYDAARDRVPYSQRGTALWLQGAGGRLDGNTIQGFKRGIYATEWTASPSHMTEVRNNRLEQNCENIIFAANAYGLIWGNQVRYMEPYSQPASGLFNPSSPVGIYLNGTQGASVSCSNTVSGELLPGDLQNVTRVGLVCRNTGYATSTRVTDNMFFKLDRAVQTQLSNPLLSLYCNTLSGNRYGIAVNPQSPWANAALGNQGTGCADWEVQADNHFSGNSSDISTWATTPWTYYAGQLPDQVPYGCAGPVTVQPPCGPGNGKHCGAIGIYCTPFGTGLPTFTRKELQLGLQRYRDLSAGGLRYSDEGQVLFTHILHGFTAVPDLQPQLQPFLEQEADDRSRRLLLPLYAQQFNTTGLLASIHALDISDADKKAYEAYYILLRDLEVRKAGTGQMTPSETGLLQDLAAGDFEVSGYARSLLEWHYGQPWYHEVEDLPMKGMSGKVKMPEGGKAGSSLGAALPNPATAVTAIAVTLSAADAANHPVLTLRNAAGVVMAQYLPAAGSSEVQVNLSGWSPGVYFYSLYVNGRLLDTKKLSVTQ